MQLDTDETMRQVDLTEQITNKLMHGFPVPPADIAEAEQLGIDIDAIALAVGACYEDGEPTEY